MIGHGGGQFGKRGVRHPEESPVVGTGKQKAGGTHQGQRFDGRSSQAGSNDVVGENGGDEVPFAVGVGGEVAESPTALDVSVGRREVTS